MIVKELIDKLEPNTRENLWDIIVDGGYYDDNKTDTINTEVKSWSLEYGLEGYHFRLTLRIYTVDYKEEE